jgi:hypothetical protein
MRASAKKKAGTVKRRNMALPEATLASIKTIRELLGASSDTEAVKKALRFTEMALVNQKAGARVVLKEKDGNDVPVIFL